MAISIDHKTRVIFVPQSFLTLVSAGFYELNIDTFRLALKDLEDDADGMQLVDTHRHNAAVTLGGVTLAATFELVNDYTVTFEDGQYVVTLVGMNSNIIDVANMNQVSLRASNSAGLVVQPGVDLATVLSAIDERFNFTVAGKVDSNLKHVNDLQVGGSGTELDPWGPV
jgi:hydrogenase maturation factor